MLDYRVLRSSLEVGAKTMNVVSMKREPPTGGLGSVAALEKAADVFSHLSNPSRLNVLLRVIEREWSVNELSADLGVSQSALSQHLGKLRQARIVRGRRARQSVFYSCNDDLVLRLLAEVGLVARA